MIELQRVAHDDDGDGDGDGGDDSDRGGDREIFWGCKRWKWRQRRRRMAGVIGSALNHSAETDKWSLVRPLLTYKNKVHNKCDSRHKHAQPTDVKANCHNDYSSSDFSAGPDSDS